ncbi:MAG: toll/interleukin-1 receptor domain-containing protein [Pirellulales bacterium]
MTWDLFISHASEDKADVARPLAEKLQSKGVNVWYDEFTLQIGDRLRQSIDDGLAKSRYGVVVLSPRFFEKKWPQDELDGLLSMETPQQTRILPVWHQVTVEQVKQFSPILAGRYGIATGASLNDIVDKLISRVMVYRVNDHHGRCHNIDLTKCECHGSPIVPPWFSSNPKRISSNWLEERLKVGAELCVYLNPTWCDGTWLVVDVPNQLGEVINLQQRDDLLPETATTAEPWPDPS